MILKNIKETNNMVKTLKETTEMMVNPDYKERFKAEYYQLMLRFRGL